MSELPSTPPPAPDPAAAERARQAAAELRLTARRSADWLKDEASTLYANYARQTKYFKWRAQIVVLYAAVALASVFLALPPFNFIGARIVAAYDYNSALVLTVTNESGQEWTDVRVVLDDRYVFEKGRVLPGEPIVTSASQFRPVRGKGDRPPSELRVQRVRVDTRQGSYTASMGP